MISDHFTRTNILGQLTFDQVETISTSLLTPSISKLLLAHGPDGSINHDSAVNTVCRSILYFQYNLLFYISGSKYLSSNIFE